MVLVANEQICHRGWLAFTNLEIPQLHYSTPLVAGGVCLYDGFEELSQGDQGEQRSSMFMDYLADLKNQNYSTVYVGVSHHNIRLQNVLNQVGFQPGQSVARVTRLGHKVFYTRKMAGDKESRQVKQATQYG